MGTEESTKNSPILKESKIHLALTKKTFIKSHCVKKMFISPKELLGFLLSDIRNYSI